MTSILRTTKYYTLGLLFFCAFVLPAHADDTNSLTLSVSPTLFEMTANPGQEWQSVIRVINSNPYDISIYVDLMNFAPQGESGQGKFIPLVGDEASAATLAAWIKPENDEYTIPAEQTLEIPFTIKVPDNAPPGGHFGALLIGTKSLNSTNGQTAVETSQVVTALVFLRVTGDIVEDGVIREFRSTAYVAEKPEMSFELRFQNKGNVHILPQGEIRIFNMWGQERGVIPVNQQTMFGNVLPNSIRKYSFSWSGEWSLADIGRYRAVATLAYGDEGRKFADAETAFWVVPWKAVLLILTILALFVSFVTWAIRLYIRKMLKMAGIQTPLQSESTAVTAETRPVKKTRGRTIAGTKKISVAAPFEEGMLDLKQRLSKTNNFIERLSQLGKFISVYKTFFTAVLLLIVFAVLFILFMRSVGGDKSYQVVINGSDQNVTLTSEDIQYEALKEQATTTDPSAVKVNFPEIHIVNRSGVPGLAATWRVKLEALGYPVVALDNEFDTADENTVIVYPPVFANEALTLSKELYGALLSARIDDAENESIVIYVGTDLQNAVE